MKNSGELAGIQSQSPEPITVHGLVVPVEWDEEGRPMALSIATFDEEEYVIDKKAADQLLESLGKEVLISGILQEVGKKKFLEYCSILKIKDTSLQPRGEGGFIVGDAVVLLAIFSLICWFALFL